MTSFVLIITAIVFKIILNEEEFKILVLSNCFFLKKCDKYVVSYRIYNSRVISV